MKKNLYRRGGKRLLDFLITVPGVILLSPLLVGVLVVVGLTIGFPVLFCQLRPGRRGKPFTIYKFRTMTSRCDAQGKLLPDADRLTAVGRFLRSTSLDELPELFNVLKGDMSLV